MWDEDRVNLTTLLNPRLPVLGIFSLNIDSFTWDDRARQALSAFLNNHATLHTLGLRGLYRDYLERLFVFDPATLKPTAMSSLSSLDVDWIHLIALLESELQSLQKLHKLVVDDKEHWNDYEVSQQKLSSTSLNSIMVGIIACGTTPCALLEQLFYQGRGR